MDQLASFGTVDPKLPVTPDALQNYVGAWRNYPLAGLTMYLIGSANEFGGPDWINTPGGTKWPVGPLKEMTSTVVQ